MLKNVQGSKVQDHPGTDIESGAQNWMPQKDQSFDLFFTHIVAHELCHGLGPHQIKVGGRETNPRFS